jgi:sulfite reductase beta subunit-like hemoprotein
MRTGLAQEDLVPAFDAIVALGAKYADRSSRPRAKIKLLVDNWGIERVREVFAEEFAAAKARGRYVALSRDETPGRLDAPPPRAPSAVPQKQPGLFTIPALIPMGELPAAAARALADAAERYGDGVVHLTPDQNAELQGVAQREVAAAQAELGALGLRTSGRGGITDVVSCVGLEYCPLAVAHSMTLGESLALALAARREDPRYEDFRIHVSGCPHSCAKHQVADIGLSGAQTEVDGVRTEAYVLYLGGNARERRLGTPYRKKIVRGDVPAAVEALLTRYEGEACAGERFSQTVARLGAPAFFETLEPVLRI